MHYSVVTTIYNDASSLASFLDEMCSQTILPDEIVIADGGSSDNTTEIIEEYKKHCFIPIVYLCGKRLNVAEGFNLAIKNAHNELVVIVAIGNDYSSNCFEELLALMANEKNDASYLPVKGKETTEFSKIYNSVILHHVQKLPSNRGVMMKRETIKELGSFYEGYKFAGEDMEFFAKFSSSNKHAAMTENAFVLWDVPSNLPEFNKQTKNYWIAVMQSFNNKDLFLLNRKGFSYCLGTILGMILLLLGTNEIMLLGATLLLISFICNITWTMKYGIKGCGLNNCHFFLRMFYTFSEAKYLLRKNKIKNVISYKQFLSI